MSQEFLVVAMWQETCDKREVRSKRWQMTCYRRHKCNNSLCTPPSQAKVLWAECILFVATFRFVTGYYRVSCLYVRGKFGIVYTKHSSTTYSAHISSNGSHFWTAGFLVYWILKVKKMCTSDTDRGNSLSILHIYAPLEATFWWLGSRCSEHIRSGKMSTPDTVRGYYVVLKYTAQISSNGSHFLTALFLVYWTYKVLKNGHIRHS